MAGCGSLGSLGSSAVSCSDLTSDTWRSLAGGQDRQAEANAVKRCGALDGMTKSEVVAWMGKPDESFRDQDTWINGSSPDGSDLPTLTVEYGEDGRVSQIYVVSL